MTHYELCKYTAEHFVKSANVALYEYKSYSTDEFPDVLVFGAGSTMLYEIKTSKSDFKADRKKECRIKTKIQYSIFARPEINKAVEVWMRKTGTERVIKEVPHMGKQRYYVCENDLINPEDIENDWGLYSVRYGKFYKIKESSMFRENLREELSILQHAIRKLNDGIKDNIIVRKYI